MKVKCSHQEHFLLISYLKDLRPHKGCKKSWSKIYYFVPIPWIFFGDEFCNTYVGDVTILTSKISPHGHQYYIIVASKHLQLTPRPLEYTILSWRTNPIVSNWQVIKIYILKLNLFGSLCSQCFFLVSGNDHWELNEPKRFLRDWIDKEQPLGMQWTKNVLGRPDWMRSIWVAINSLLPICSPNSNCKGLVYKYIVET
jgi:hypothetical protein